MLLQLGAEPAEWELLDSLSRPSISTVEQCRGNFMPTWTLGGCKWIADGTNCTDSGMFWFNQGFSNVYAMCAWDEASSACAFDREGGTTCAVTFWEPDVDAPAAAPAVDDTPTLAKKPVYTTASKHHHSTGKTEITEPLLAAMVHNKETEAREEAPVAKKASVAEKAAPAHKKNHKHNTVATAIKSAKAGKHMVAAKGKLSGKKAHHQKEEPEEEEEFESTHEDAFLEMLSARQNAANTAAQEDFHETILNAVDTNALQQHYLQNNNIAQQNVDNTAVGLANLKKNMEIQLQNDLIVGAWSEGLTDPDLPRDLEQHSLDVDRLSPLGDVVTPEEEAVAFMQRQAHGYNKKQW